MSTCWPGTQPGARRQALRAGHRAIALNSMREDAHRLLVRAPPFSLVFRAEPGKEDVLLKVASAYEAASRRRIPPPAFGPLRAGSPLNPPE